MFWLLAQNLEDEKKWASKQAAQTVLPHQSTHIRDSYTGGLPGSSRTSTSTPRHCNIARYSAATGGE
jgi:hypothetical protein